MIDLFAAVRRQNVLVGLARGALQLNHTRPYSLLSSKVEVAIAHGLMVEKNFEVK